MADTMDKKAIGARIKALRKARGWQQKQLALMVGVRYEQINKYESGFNMPPAETLVRLAEALDTTVDYLFTGAPMDEAKFSNARLFRHLQALDQLDEAGQQALVRILDALIAQQRIASVMVPVD